MNSEYESIMNEIRKKKSDWTSVTITMNGATNVNHESVINVMACGPMPFFLEHVHIDIKKETTHVIHGKVLDVAERMRKWLLLLCWLTSY